MLHVYPGLEIGHRFHSQALLPTGRLSSPAVYKDSGGITESINNSWYFIHMQIRLCSCICIFSRWDTGKFWPIESHVGVYRFHKKCAWRLGITVRNQSKLLFNILTIWHTLQNLSRWYGHSKFKSIARAFLVLFFSIKGDCFPLCVDYPHFSWLKYDGRNGRHHFVM